MLTPSSTVISRGLVAVFLLAAASQPQVAGSFVPVPSTTATASTLVVYAVSGHDKENKNNLQYFLEYGIRDDDGCDYVIVLVGTKAPEEAQLLSLPPNARYLRHPRNCSELGVFGWLLSSNAISIKSHKFFVLLSGTVRGPYQPAYAKTFMHWTTAFTSRISQEVKLVGSTIACLGEDGSYGASPHVQAYAMATDQEGLQLLADADGVLACHSDASEAFRLGELGASRAMLAAGRNLDCLMLRYQGVDWRLPGAQRCNANRSPIDRGQLDGGDVNPLEVMFVMVQERMNKKEWASVEHALRLQAWQNITTHATPEEQIAAMSMHAGLSADAIQKTLRKFSHKHDCFDWQFYLSQNADLASWVARQVGRHTELELAWSHFISSGAREERPVRFTC